MTEQRHRRRGRPQGGSALHHRQGPLHRRHQPARQAYAYFVRSRTRMREISGIDKAAAESMPGVLAVLTGEDAKADGWAT